MGIYGIGRIGSEFAKRVHAMGCKVIAYDIEAGNTNRIFPDFVEFVSKEELIAKSDIISIHCPLRPDTYHIFGKEQFKAMKESALDVVEHEPLTKDNPLLKHDNFIVSPHTAWYSEESAEELNRKVAEEAVRFLKNEPVHYPVNLKNKKINIMRAIQFWVVEPLAFVLL